jgi:cell division septum initiation protein DivIVA
MRERAATATGLSYGEAGGKPKAQALREAEDTLAHAKREAEHVRRRAVADAKHITDQAHQDAQLILECARHTKRTADQEKKRNIAFGSALARKADDLAQVEKAKEIRTSISRMLPMPKQRQNENGRERHIGE